MDQATSEQEEPEKRVEKIERTQKLDIEADQLHVSTAITTTNIEHSFVMSYLDLRKMVGIIGMALPVVLVLGRMILESHGILDSISAYYYSVMRDVLVGSLCAIAVFLLSYRYSYLDDILGDLAGISAIGIALFPTAPDKATEQQVIIGELHLLFAACFFITLAIFALVLFRRTKEPTPQKRQRNIVYTLCGITILACLVLIVLVDLLPDKILLQPFHPVFWFEFLGIFAFGFAWFVKGKTLLKDK